MHSIIKAIYRDVPTFDEIKAESQDPNYSPKLADNAESIIDWALSHIPERMLTLRTRKTQYDLILYDSFAGDGPRRSRAKKRREHRAVAMRVSLSSN